jgi:hypothetical protein
MRYVILRDDDTNAFTPPECLERLYRPLLDRGLPVNLAAIPAVSRQARMANGSPEGFLVKQGAEESGSVAVPIGENAELVAYLLDNPGYKVIQHGCHHDYLEFDADSQAVIRPRLDEGRRLLQDAGFAKPDTFVAPYDRLSRAALREVATRFRVLSTGWYELRRLPYTWWASYALKKLRHRPHWRIGRTLLLSHPGCLLSCHRNYSTMIGAISHYVRTQQLTVVVTHWWEYFRNGEPDQAMIDFLHETGSYLATHPDLKVISFSDLVDGNLPLN